MKTMKERLQGALSACFEGLSLDPAYAVVTESNRPDLCEFQCNGALALAKKQKRPPMEIAGEVAAALTAREDSPFSEVTAAPPGFLNLKVSETFLAGYVEEMGTDPRLGVGEAPEKKTIVVDYGGANVAKPLHVGHLRPAVIGESIKRMYRFLGHEVVGDVHLGDWGLQMGLIFEELKRRKPDLPWFDPAHSGAYPEEPPFTIDELEEIYPAASARSKEDAAFRDAAMAATHALQEGEAGYRDLFQKVMDVSIRDLKKNYGRLMVDFDLWMGESSVQDLIAPMVEDLKEKGLAHVSEGALVVDVSEEKDAKEIPPCIILKSDGAALYATTDLATLVWRQEHLHPDRVVYVADKRQSLHFTQVFRCAKKGGIVPEATELIHIGNGTMNGPDGKPFKTRDGGVMRLQMLLDEIEASMYGKLRESSRGEGISEEESRKTARQVALAALKYGDLANQAAKDYVFDMDRFLSFEGNTGPYLLYTIVRIRSILRRYEEEGGGPEVEIPEAKTPSEKALSLTLSSLSETVHGAAEANAPHRICAWAHALAEAFNHFYHETKVLTEPDPVRKAQVIRLLAVVERALLLCIDLLGFTAPERM